MKIVTMAVGFAAGYVLGTRAGRERFDQIVSAVRELADQPRVAEAQAKVQELAARGRDAVVAKVSPSGNGAVSSTPVDSEAY